MFAVGTPGQKVRLYLGLRRVAERQRQPFEALIETPGIVMDATIALDGLTIIPPESPHG